MSGVSREVAEAAVERLDRQGYFANREGYFANRAGPRPVWIDAVKDAKQRLELQLIYRGYVYDPARGWIQVGAPKPIRLCEVCGLKATNYSRTYAADVCVACWMAVELPSTPVKPLRRPLWLRFLSFLARW